VAAQLVDRDPQVFDGVEVEPQQRRHAPGHESGEANLPRERRKFEPNRLIFAGTGHFSSPRH
jgi:hypothetical protein